MIDLRCSVISLRSVNLRIVAEYLDGDKLLFHRGGFPYSYDLSTGVICYDKWDDTFSFGRTMASAHNALHNHHPSQDFDSMDDMARAAEYREWVFNDSNLGSILIPTNEVLAAILSLASRQVKGDELIKGLKAMGLQMPKSLKITSLYTGGWIITGYLSDGEALDVESFANALLYDNYEMD